MHLIRNYNVFNRCSNFLRQKGWTFSTWIFLISFEMAWFLIESLAPVLVQVLFPLLSFKTIVYWTYFHVGIDCFACVYRLSSAFDRECPNLRCSDRKSWTCFFTSSHVVPPSIAFSSRHEISVVCVDHTSPSFHLKRQKYQLFEVCGIGVARGAKGAVPPKFLENIAILCFERSFFKENSAICLKSNILAPPQNLWAGYANSLWWETRASFSKKFFVCRFRVSCQLAKLIKGAFHQAATEHILLSCIYFSTSSQLQSLYWRCLSARCCSPSQTLVGHDWNVGGGLGELCG